MHNSHKSLLGAAVLLAMLSGCGDDAVTQPAPSGPTGGGVDTVGQPPPAPKASNGITVLAPNGGGSFRVGSPLAISWTSTNVDFTSANLTIDCGLNDWYSLAKGSIDPVIGDTTLVIPDSVYSPSQRKLIAFPTGTNCKVKISDYAIASILDTSDTPFTVLPK